MAGGVCDRITKGVREFGRSVVREFGGSVVRWFGGSGRGSMEGKRGRTWIWIGGVAVAFAAGLNVGWYWMPILEVFANTFFSRTVQETIPGGAGQGQRVAAGQFAKVHWPGEGNATIYRLQRGDHLLRLSEFSVQAGPKLHVYLARAPEVRENADVGRAGYLDLGRLKGNQGDQNYDIPSGTAPGEYRSVVIWCALANKVFAAASLKQP
jgi:hypothetical protein